MVEGMHARKHLAQHLNVQVGATPLQAGAPKKRTHKQLAADAQCVYELCARSKSACGSEMVD
jgi:hypothetical protein